MKYFIERLLCFVGTLLFVLSFFSCATATGTALVTGMQRPPTTPEDVKIYTEVPENYDVIGIVTASSDSGWTEQGDLEYALAEIKKQAAKIGANGIILENISTSNSGGYFVYGVYFNATAKNVSGKAIYVFENKD